MILPPGRKSKHPAAGPKGGFELIFHIAVCSPDSVLRSRVERQCLDYYARRDDACIVEQLDGPEALLARDDAGERYELYLIELPSTAAGGGAARWLFWPIRPPTPTAPTGWTPCSIYCCPSRPSS